MMIKYQLSMRLRRCGGENNDDIVQLSGPLRTLGIRQNVGRDARMARLGDTSKYDMTMTMSPRCRRCGETTTERAQQLYYCCTRYLRRMLYNETESITASSSSSSINTQIQNTRHHAQHTGKNTDPTTLYDRMVRVNRVILSVTRHRGPMSQSGIFY